MNLVDAFGRQSKSAQLAEAFVALAAVALLDIVTPWQFSMFVFYAVPVFLVALHQKRRVGIGFAICTAVIGWLANYDSLKFRTPAGYVWSGVNRQCAMLFVAACGISIQSFREEMRRRLLALEHSQELEREIVRVSEREQMRIGQDLHDGVCQTLAALDCAAQCLKIDLETEGSAKAKLAGEIKDRLSEATLEARNLARGIYPVTMEVDGLSVALQGLVMTTKSLHHARINFESDDQIVVKDPEVAMHLYRITQEALNNAMRHANASQVDIRLTRGDHRLSISVVDDGRGSAVQGRPDGMGLRTMRYRAKLIGADINVENNPSGGTAVRCVLPVPSRPV